MVNPWTDWLGILKLSSYLVTEKIWENKKAYKSEEIKLKVTILNTK